MNIFTPSDLERLSIHVSSESLSELEAAFNSVTLQFPKEIYDEDGNEVDFDDISLESWDDDCGEAIYQIGEKAYLLVSHEQITELAKAESIEDYLSNWDWESYGTKEDMFVAFGLEPEIEEAEESYEGECRIWVNYNYFGGTCNAPRDGWLRDEYNNISTFANYAEAEEWVGEGKKGIYYLSHGEHSRPNYIISPN